VTGDIVLIPATIVFQFSCLLLVVWKRIRYGGAVAWKGRTITVAGE